MQLEFESGTVIDSPKLEDLAQLEREEYSILSRDPLTYIQCARTTERPWGYHLEYQDGSTDQHFEAINGPFSLHQVVEAFRKYLWFDDTWTSDFEWQKLDL